MESFEVQLSSRLFPLQTSPGFLLKAKHLLVTSCLSETCRPCYEYFESSEMNRALNPFSLGCLPLSCPACVPYVKWFLRGGGALVGGSVYLPVHISLYVYGGDKGQEMNNYNQWVQLSRLFSYLLWFFFLLLLCLKLEVILWMQESTGMSPEKQLQIWLRTELLKSTDGGCLCVALNYHFFPIN